MASWNRGKNQCQESYLVHNMISYAICHLAADEDSCLSVKSVFFFLSLSTQLMLENFHYHIWSSLDV